MQFSPELVDPGRRSRACAPEMTPLKIEDGTATFGSPEGELYFATMSECSCPDFRFNQRQQKPCKHIVRLAMVQGAFPSDGMIEDAAAPFRVLYAGILEKFMKAYPIPLCIRAIRIINDLKKKGVDPACDDCLDFAGVPSLAESGLVMVREKDGRYVVHPECKNLIKKLNSTLAGSIGEFVLLNLDNEELLSFFESVE